MFVVTTLLANVLLCVYAENYCSDIKAIDNFNLNLFASGVWYEIARYPTEWENHADCLIARFTSDGRVYKFNITEVSDNTHELGTFGGDVELESGSKTSGVINYVSPTYEAYLGTNKMTAAIVAVDYEHYCIFYECKFNAATQRVRDHLWIISRSKILDPESKKRIEAIFTTHPKLDYNKLIWIHFTKDACRSQSRK